MFLKALKPKKLKETIFYLGASFIKLAQVLATRSDFFSKEYLDELKGLHDKLPKMSKSDFEGLGGALLLKERVEEELKTLQEKGKIKTSDAKSFLESLEQKGKDEDERIKAKIKDMFKEVLDELGVATKADLEKLKEDLK